MSGFWDAVASARPHANNLLIIAECVSKKNLKSVNIWQSYKQERGCLMHCARLANILLIDEESAQDNHVYAYNFAKYSPILIFYCYTQQ